MAHLTNFHRGSDDEAMDVDGAPVVEDKDDLSKYNMDNYDDDAEPDGEFFVYTIVLFAQYL